MIILFIFIFGQSVFGAENYCNFEIDGKEIELSTGITTFSLRDCGMKDNTLYVNFCSNIPEADCPSTKTKTPTNICNHYTGSGPAYYWEGSSDISQVSHSNHFIDDEYWIYYSNDEQSFGANITFKCNTKSVEKKCEKQTSSPSTYQLYYESPIACPKIAGKGYWFVQYEEDCGEVGGYQIANYFGQHCYEDHSDEAKRSVNFECTDKKAMMNIFNDNDVCSQTPSYNLEFNLTCNRNPLFVGYQKVFCTDDYEVEYNSGLFFFALNVEEPEYSHENPLAGRLYYPTTSVPSRCKKSLTSQGHYYQAKCSEEIFKISLFDDDECLNEKTSQTLYPGDYVDMGLYFEGIDTTFYAMFVECLKN